MARKAPACLPGSASSASSVLSKRTLCGGRLNEFLLKQWSPWYMTEILARIPDRLAHDHADHYKRARLVARIDVPRVKRASCESYL